MMIMATKATSGLAKKLPNAWDERKRIWKEAFRTSPALKPHEPDALKFLAELEDVAKDRHTIFHCSWERLNAGPPLNAKIAILRPTKGDKDSFDFSRETITINQVRGVAQKASRLNIELKPWSDLLSAQRGPLPAGIHEL